MRSLVANYLFIIHRYLLIQRVASLSPNKVKYYVNLFMLKDDERVHYRSMRILLVERFIYRGKFHFVRIGVIYERLSYCGFSIPAWGASGFWSIWTGSPLSLLETNRWKTLRKFSSTLDRYVTTYRHSTKLFDKHTFPSVLFRYLAYLNTFEAIPKRTYADKTFDLLSFYEEDRRVNVPQRKSNGSVVSERTSESENSN